MSHSVGAIEIENGSLVSGPGAHEQPPKWVHESERQAQEDGSLCNEKAAFEPLNPPEDIGLSPMHGFLCAVALKYSNSSATSTP